MRPDKVYSSVNLKQDPGAASNGTAPMMSNQGRMLMQSIYNPVLGVNSSQDIRAHGDVSGRVDDAQPGVLMQNLVAQGEARGPDQTAEQSALPPEAAAKGAVGGGSISPLDLQVDPDAAEVVVQ